MKHKFLILILCLVLMLSLAVPGTLALASEDEDTPETTEPFEDTQATDETESVPEDVAEPTSSESDQDPDETEAPADTVEDTQDSGVAVHSDMDEDSESAEVPGTADETDPVPEDTRPDEDDEVEESDEGEDDADEGEDLSLYEKLMAAQTAEEFDAIILAAAEDELVFSCAEFDALDDYYVYLTTGAYPDHSPVVDHVSTTVNFTNVAPLVGSGK